MIYITESYRVTYNEGDLFMKKFISVLLTLTLIDSSLLVAVGEKKEKLVKPKVSFRKIQREQQDEKDEAERLALEAKRKALEEQERQVAAAALPLANEEIPGEANNLATVEATTTETSVQMEETAPVQGPLTEAETKAEAPKLPYALGYYDKTCLLTAYTSHALYLLDKIEIDSSKDDKEFVSHRTNHGIDHTVSLIEVLAKRYADETIASLEARLNEQAPHVANLTLMISQAHGKKIQINEARLSKALACLKHYNETRVQRSTLVAQEDLSALRVTKALCRKTFSMKKTTEEEPVLSDEEYDDFSGLFSKINPAKSKIE